MPTSPVDRSDGKVAPAPPLLRLRIDFLGFVDFAQQTMGFRATLVDSSLVRPEDAVESVDVSEVAPLSDEHEDRARMLREAGGGI